MQEHEIFQDCLISECEGLFRPISSSRESSHEEVEIIFKGQEIRWTISTHTTYEDLSKAASDFWGFNRDFVFLSSHSPGYDEIADLYLPNQFVRSEISKWKRVRLKDYRLQYYIVFSREMLHLSFLNIPLKPDYLTQPSISEETHARTDEPVETNKKKWNEQLKRRIKKHKIFTLVQTCTMILLTGLWVFSMLFDYNISSACWINSQIQSTLIGEFNGIHSIYQPYVKEKYYTIREENHFWDYQNILEKLIFLRTFQGIEGALDNFNYIYGRISLRQVRSELHFCENSAGQTIACPSKYSLGKNTTDYSSKNEGFIYDDEGENIYYFGNQDIYSTDGFESIFDPTNHATWAYNTNNLIANNWIDVQTRGIFMTFNVVNPSESILTNIILSTEIGEHGSFIPIFKIGYYNYDHLTVGKISVHVIIILLLGSLIAYEIRELSLQEDEARYFKRMKFKKEIRNYTARLVLSSWEAHDKKPFFKRLRLPKGIEILVFLALIVGFVIEVIYTCWTLVEILSIEMDANEFTDLYPLGLRFEVVNTIRLLVFILLTMINTRLTMLWFNSLAEKYLVLTNTLKQVYPFLLFTVFACVIFSVSFHFILGPYSVMSSSMHESILNTMNLFLGQISIDKHYDTFYDPMLLAALLTVFALVDYLFFGLFILLFRWEIASVKCKRSNM